MIIVRFHGGLGNQIFEYCFFRYLQETYDCEIKADLTWFDRNYKEHQGYELNRVFGIELPAASYREVASIHEYYPRYYPFAALRYLSRIIAAWRNRKRDTGDSHIFDFGPTQYCFNPVYTSLDTGKDWYIEGVFCSDEYLKLYEDKIRKELTFYKPLTGNNLMWANQMVECQSVAIHVRRGDYVGNVFDIVGTEYYKRAVEYIRNKVADPVFFVFSDDMEYIEQEFTFLSNYIPIHNEKKESYMDMQLIGCCRHSIIANSSFSYWGALLGEQPASIIIAPKKYKADEDLALARKHWILL